MALVDELDHRLLAWAQAHVAPDATVSDRGPMPGHAGLSFGFTVSSEAEGDRRYVIRLAPPGVTRRGNTDVLKQVPLLEALGRGGVPIAKVVWSTDDPQWFGTDAMVQEFLTGKPLHMTEPESGVTPIDGEVGPYVKRAVEAIAGVHALDWTTLLPDWETPRVMSAEIDFWAKLLGKAAEDEWRVQGEELAERLRATDPGDHRTGIFHGDFQTNNILFSPTDGSIDAIVDWEIAGIGAVGLDVGWLSMMCDRAAWHPINAADMQVLIDPDDIRRWYEDASGRPLEHYDWYRAYACFRYGAIAGMNIYLHRSGRRVDEHNESTAPSVPCYFRRGMELVG